MTFGKRLMQLRKEHGYRNRDTFAAELGIPANTTAVDVQSISEQQLIEKYRLLDCTGKELVDYTIAIELKRTTLLENQKNRILHYEQAFNFLKQS